MNIVNSTLFVVPFHFIPIQFLFSHLSSSILVINTSLTERKCFRLKYAHSDILSLLCCELFMQSFGYTSFCWITEMQLMERSWFDRSHMRKPMGITSSRDYLCIITLIPTGHGLCWSEVVEGGTQPVKKINQERFTLSLVLIN